MAASSTVCVQQKKVKRIVVWVPVIAFPHKIANNITEHLQENKLKGKDAS